MRRWARRAVILGAVLGAAGPAQAQAPLSIIDWLEAEEVAPATPSDITETATQPDIDVQPLEHPAEPIGLVPGSVTGMPVTLWTNSAAETLVRLIHDSPVAGHPALQSLLYSLLLTEAGPAQSDSTGEAALLARIDRLLALGAVDPAKALIEEAGQSRSPALFARWAEAAFLTGEEDQVCSQLAQAPALAPDPETLIFCVARRGDLARATLLFDAHSALGDLSDQTAAALDRFLHPELFEDAAPLPQPRQPSPLLFRLYEAIGERLPTAPLPRRFAVADLRDVAGWKAQLEAAERLARTGAMATNTLLGLYSERQPAASGGVWDRVAAVQRFETALATGSADAVAKTLPDAWDQMARAGLLVILADLFAGPLSEIPLEAAGPRALAQKIYLLSPDYERLSTAYPAQSPRTAFWRGVARGDPSREAAPDAQSAAIQAGFRPIAPAGVRINRDQPGETILRAIELFDRGAAGNLDDLTRALQIFRALGLEDAARRASLQLMIMGQG